MPLSVSGRVTYKEVWRRNTHILISVSKCFPFGAGTIDSRAGRALVLHTTDLVLITGIPFSSLT